MEDEIIKIIEASLKPQYLKVINESHFHKNHIGSPQTGQSHFCIKIKSNAFKKKKTLECHRVIYNLLDEQIKNGLHALRIEIIKD